MANEKCPICSGKIFLEYCVDCGYRVPNENDISSTYNYDPSDYKTPNFDDIITPEITIPEDKPIADKFKEIKTPEVVKPAKKRAVIDYESDNKPKVVAPPISQNKPEDIYDIPSIDFETPTGEVKDVTPYTVKPKEVTNYDIPDISNTVSEKNIYDQPYKNIKPEQDPNSENPYANKNFTPYVDNTSSSDSSENATIRQFIVDEWFKLIFTLFFGFFGIIWAFILYSIYRKKAYNGDGKYEKYQKYMIVFIIILFFIKGISKL